MLIQSIFSPIFILAAVSCARYSDSEKIEITDHLSLFSTSTQSEKLDQLQFRPFIDIALNTPEVSSQLDFFSHAILYSFYSSNIYTDCLYDFVLAEWDFSVFEFDLKDPLHWHALINFTFRDFARKYPEQAQIIVEKQVLPNHPFLSQVNYCFQITDFNNQFIPDMDVFLDKTAKNIFAQKFSQILNLENSSEAQILLKALLYKVKEPSCYAPDYKYHHAFLASVPFHYYKNTYFPPHEYFSDIESYISRIASALYRAIAEISQQEADEILAGLVPSHYSTLTDTSYENTIQEYESSLQQTIDQHPYIWDPQLFSCDILAALATNEDNLSSTHISILRIISQDLPLGHLFRHFIAQNYLQRPNLPTEQQLLFWHSLIFSSFTEFSTIFPYHANLILQEISLSSEDLDKLFYYGRLDEQFSPSDHFHVVAGWGHTPTVELLMHLRADISADDASSALFAAAEGGHTSTVSVLLQLPFNITSEDAGFALYNAAQGGHTETVELLLQFPDISADDIGLAYKIAAKCGHTATFEVLQSCSYISADNAGLALRNASQDFPI